MVTFRVVSAFLILRVHICWFSGSWVYTVQGLRFRV